MFQQLYGGSIGAASQLLSQSAKEEITNSDIESAKLGTGSDTSVITNFSDCRPTPVEQEINCEVNSQ